MDAKRWGVFGILGLVILLALLYHFQGGLGSGSDGLPEGPVVSAPPLADAPRHPPDQYAPSPNFWVSPPSPAAPPRTSSRMVTEEMLAIAQEARDYREELKRQSVAWMADFLADPDVATETKETYRMRALANIQPAVAAFEAKDYQAAIAEFRKALDDPASSPTTRYFCYDYMREAAAQMKDENAYLEFCLAQAELLKNGDFSHMGYDRLDAEASIAWVQDAARQLKAAKDPAAFDAYVDEIMKKWNVPAGQRSQVESDVKEKIHELRKRIFG